MERRQRQRGMIRFITTADLPFFPGRGGTEAFTISLVRELRGRGIDAGILAVGLKEKDGREFWPDVPFEDVARLEDVASKDITFISGSAPHTIPTKLPSYVIMHVPPLATAYPIKQFAQAAKHANLITNSSFTRNKWAACLGLPPEAIRVVHPFADPAFAAVKRPKNPGSVTRVLFAGRLSTHKGIYLFLEALHHKPLQHGYSFTVVAAGNPNPEREIINTLLRAHPRINLVDARLTPDGMARLLAAHDILAMPSNHFHWQEAFGMLSVEAQHAGCRVVGSNAAGLPETDCGSLTLFKPGDSYDLALAVERAAKARPVPPAQRAKTAQQFTLAQTADSLLAIIQADLKA